MFKGHQKGLYLLFATEMWERFSFYGMRALLVLYMTARIADGGQEWSDGEALRLYGLYLGAAYLTPILGGIISDRYLGQRRSAMLGAWLMAMGHFCMAFNNLYVFYAALALVALGNGFFKPCLTSILGQLYDEEDESHRDHAYSIFYMGINIGAALSTWVVGLLRVNYGFDYGFLAAAFAMVIALIVFWWGKDKFLEDKGIAPSAQITNHHEAPLTSDEKSRLGVIGFLFVATIFFIAAMEQIGGLVTLFINSKVDRTFMGGEIPTEILANIDPFMIILMAPLLGALWRWLGTKGMDPFVGAKMGMGCLFMSSSFLVLRWMSQQDMPSWHWIVLNKLFLVFGELCFIPISWAAATRLAPKAMISRVMAVMLAGIGVGGYFAGYIGSFVEILGEEVIFYGFAVMTAGLGAVLLAVSPKLKRMCRGLH
jgi:POT family proton-dependent oligopeptide transporter